MNRNEDTFRIGEKSQKFEIIIFLNLRSIQFRKKLALKLSEKKTGDS